MAKINLLPWRDVYRKEKKDQFIAILIAVLLASCVGAYLWMSSVESAIENQTARNRLLETHIAELQKQVDEIKQLQKVREDLLARIKVIQDLEGTRPVIVRFFDEFVRAVPDGVYLSLLSRAGEVFSIEGIAESTNRVSSFMRNLDESDWFKEPSVVSVIAAPKVGEEAKAFKLTVKSSAPAETVDTAEGEQK
jgi:type IV pilus assembly protein PilN